MHTRCCHVGHEMKAARHRQTRLGRPQLTTSIVTTSSTGVYWTARMAPVLCSNLPADKHRPAQPALGSRFLPVGLAWSLVSPVIDNLCVSILRHSLLLCVPAPSTLTWTDCRKEKRINQQ